MQWCVKHGSRATGGVKLCLKRLAFRKQIIQRGGLTRAGKHYYTIQKVAAAAGRRLHTGGSGTDTCSQYSWANFSPFAFMNMKTDEGYGPGELVINLKDQQPNNGLLLPANAHGFQPKRTVCDLRNA